ncbi:MAG: ABC transporter permease subunit [Ferroplasma sp.]|uniref:ABC transporter permease n=1 Tax=Ferroplasma sp. TaxID=2591003 RepID=UPI002815784B|nr:ABC transporter permease subunit [Ferroplasma sp.]WMT50581.1 MAG: ABC transporter permease subunit [Ferroplasma sp.]
MEEEFQHIKIFYKDYMHFASRSRIMLEMIVVDAAILAFIAYKISQIGHVKTIWTRGTAFSATLGGFSYFIICWTVTFMGSFAISKDFTTNTAKYILSLPVKRSSIFTGRYLAATTLASIATASLFGFIAGLSYYYFGTIPVTLLKAYFVSVLVVLSAMSIVFLLSSLIKTDRFVLMGSMFLFFLVMPVIDGIFQLNSINVNSLLYVDANMVTKTIGHTPYFSYISFIQIVPQNYNLLNANYAIISMIIYIVLLFVLGLFIYNRKQLH